VTVLAHAGLVVEIVLILGLVAVFLAVKVGVRGDDEPEDGR
jgi:hypothetical protein